MLTQIIADGTCSIEPLLRPGEVAAYAKPADAGIAALTVIRKCVAGIPSTGGMTQEFGER